MRIAILTNSYPPEARGGSGRIAELQADWLLSNGHDVCIWVPAPFSDTTNSDHIKSFKTQTAVPFSKLADQNPLARLTFHIEDLNPNADLVEDIRNFKPDVLLTHNLTGCGWGTPGVLQNAGINWIHILHDVQMIEPSGQILYNESLPSIRSLWRKFWSKKRSKVLGTPNTVVSPSTWLLNFHKQYNLFTSSKTSIIPNPVLKTDIKKNESNNERSVLYVGRVSKDKGIHILVEAWQKVESKPGKLKIIGDGPHLKAIKQLNDSTIECLGSLDHSELAKHYGEASLFVFPSLLMENQPTVLIEAISHGLNIVASDIGGVGELLQGYGELIPPGSSDKLADAINSEISKQPNLELGQKILIQHNIDSVMNNYIANFN